MNNPFTPTFGAVPPLLVGRDAEIAAVRRALAGGPGDPYRAVLATGTRGVGKTVLLTALEDVAREAGWVVVSETARAGLAASLTETALPAILAGRDRTARAGRLTGVSANVLGFGASVNRELTDARPVKPSFRSQLTELAAQMSGDGGGVFLTIDEVHRAKRAELAEVFQAVQHTFREGLPVAVAAAGLPSSVKSILSDDVLTFLRRARRWDLAPVADSLVAAALREPIGAAGRSVSPDGLDLAVAAVRGYPFLIQMVGYEMWAAEPGLGPIGAAQVRAALPRATRLVSQLVHEPLLADLSPVDRAFLRAMAAAGEDPVPIAEIGRRMGRAQSFMAKYRARLIAAEVIEAAGRGRVRFAVPLLADHLRALDQST